MIKGNLSQTFNSRLRLSTLESDWHRIARQMSPVELLKFPDNPLFAINAIAEEFGCELSSVRSELLVDLRFVKRYGRNKMMWTMTVDHDLFADWEGLEALLRTALPGQVAMANDRNTIHDYFGPASGD